MLEIHKECREICKQAHEGQTDKNGEPYYLHPITVSEHCKSQVAKCVALLHDVLEDTEWTSTDLLEYGIPTSIVDIVILLTKNPEEDYLDYIKKVMENPIAAEVKYQDLKHNTNLRRSNGVIMVSDNKWKNYQKALKILNKRYHFE